VAGSPQHPRPRQIGADARAEDVEEELAQQDAPDAVQAPAVDLVAGGVDGVSGSVRADVAAVRLDAFALGEVDGLVLEVGGAGLAPLG